ncbi:hypothetical protein EI613_26950 [Azospirillum sp. 412522]|nr:hypothetical protein [Azospirillum sp. 412522]MBY6265531.1 hypothetical protein [Azospirillum sp. 412522]
MSYISPIPVQAEAADALLATPINPAHHRQNGDATVPMLQHINGPFGRRIDADAVAAILTRRTNA